MQASHPKQTPSSFTTDRQITLLLFAALLAINLRMIAPGILAGDAGEFQLAAWRLGLAHATGYPLYLLIGGGWQHLLALLKVAPATALNALSAVIGALSVALLYRLLVDWLPGSLIVRRITALFAALFFAFNPTFWSQNLIAEVYTLHALLLVAIFWQMQKIDGEMGRWGEREKGRKETQELSPCRLVTLSFLYGLALTHHATTIFLAPGLLLAVSLARPGWWKNWRTLLNCAVALIVPLLLYCYVPLRSGMAASPWYYLRLGDETIALYGDGWQGFVDFVTGRSISVGFHDLRGAVAALGQAGTLWQIHFGWVGLAIMGIGVIALVRSRQWTILALTLPFALILQIFNLFYAIGDILVYYIPLYLVGVIWAAFGVVGIGEVGRWGGGEKEEGGVRSAESPPASNPIGVVIAALLLLLPVQHYQEYQPLLNQAGMTTATTTWQAILAAKPEPNAILVSNDRNEIVPLYYLQQVDHFATSLTGLFPLITPNARFADIGTTVASALQTGQPVYLIKPMPGLEVRFDLAAATAPLVRVVGPAVVAKPKISVGQTLGQLTLVGYDWQQQGEMVQIELIWQVDGKLDGRYTTTVQLFDEAGEKIVQDDSPPGGDFYPTMLWKVGEKLLDRHALRLPADKQATKLLVAMYSTLTMTQLAEPIVLELKP